MKRRWKRLVSAGLVCTMAAGLAAGCGTKNEDAGEGTEGGSGDVVELRWLSSQIGETAEAEWFSGVVEGFNEEYEGKIHISVDGVAGEGVSEKLKTDAAGGTMPDLFMLNADAARFNLIADAEVAVDLTPYFEENPELWERVDKNSAAAYTDDEGRLLGLPYAASYIGIFYFIGNSDFGIRGKSSPADRTYVKSTGEWT